MVQKLEVENLIVSQAAATQKSESISQLETKLKEACMRKEMHTTSASTCELDLSGRRCKKANDDVLLHFGKIRQCSITC